MSLRFNTESHRSGGPAIILGPVVLTLFTLSVLLPAAASQYAPYTPYARQWTPRTQRSPFAHPDASHQYDRSHQYERSYQYGHPYQFGHAEQPADALAAFPELARAAPRTYSGALYAGAYEAAPQQQPQHAQDVAVGVARADAPSPYFDQEPVFVTATGAEVEVTRPVTRHMRKYLRRNGPSKCPAKCRMNPNKAHLDCSLTRKIFRRCAVRTCTRPNGKPGVACVPSSGSAGGGKCPNKFRRSAAGAWRDCRRNGRRRRKCQVDVVYKTLPDGRDLRGYACADINSTAAATPEPTPEPTPVPTPHPTISPGDGDFDIVIDNVKLGEDLTFPLKFENMNSGTLKEDYFLLVDATGSMGEAISTAKANFLDIVAKRREASDDVAFGVGYYRDEASPGGAFVNAQAITTDEDAVQTAINGLKAMGGGDPPEANLVAMYKVATDSNIGWREGSRKIIVHFGDVAGHEPSCFQGLTYNRAMVVDALKKKEIVVVAASFSTGLDSSTSVYGCGGAPAGPGQSSYITSETGGGLVKSEDQSQLIELLENAVKALPLTYKVDGSDCAGKISSSYTPTFPFSLESGESKSVVQKLTIEEGACPGSFFCEIRYTASGGDLGTATVKVNTVTGC